ncbi:MAG: SDR family NAD(P)-dependent oxidoreductase, partial [Actinomycetota bacterium]|nr:SDR family NAD(P)-dependent oxidoreductase [Actinomycetota bacterium]
MSGRVVVVTGASGGVGRAVAQAFGEAGDAVALLARGRAGLEAAADQVRAGGGRALVLPTDTADAAAVEAAAERVESELGLIDIWVNDAFTSVFAPFAEITAEEFRRVTEVSYLGYVYGT